MIRDAMIHDKTKVDILVKVGNDHDSFAEYRLSAESNRTLLDLLERLRAGGQAVPAYRHSCHHGSCGTCGAVINGLPSLMCLTTVADMAVPRPRLPGGPAVEPERDSSGAIVVTLEPLPNMTIVSGIAVIPGPVFAGIPHDTSYLMPSVEAGGLPPAGKAPLLRKAPLPADPEGARVDAGDSLWRPAGRVRFEACIECGLCVSACPVGGPFIGPAALAAVNRELQKRPERTGAMLSIAAAPDGVEPCGRFLACSRVCPQAVYPGKHIQLLRNALAESTQIKR